MTPDQALYQAEVIQADHERRAQALELALHQMPHPPEDERSLIAYERRVYRLARKIMARLN